MRPRVIIQVAWPQSWPCCRKNPYLVFRAFAPLSPTWDPTVSPLQADVASGSSPTCSSLSPWYIMCFHSQPWLTRLPSLAMPPPAPTNQCSPHLSASRVLLTFKALLLPSCLLCLASAPHTRYHLLQVFLPLTVGPEGYGGLPGFYHLW